LAVSFYILNSMEGMGFLPPTTVMCFLEQNSKFLQFVSKMSRGELIVDDNQVKPGVANPVSDTWADEFQQQHPAPPETWAAEFTAGEVSFLSFTY